MANAGWMGGWDAFAADSEPDSEPHGDTSGDGNEDGWDATVSGWSDRTPAGRRSGLNPDAATTKAARTPHQQQVTHDDAYYSPGFTWTQFVAYLKDGGKFNKNGDLEMTLIIPFEFKHLGVPLTDAVGLPLSFDVQLWQPFATAQASGE